MKPAPASAAPAAVASKPSTGSIAWTDEVRRTMEAVRGVSIAPPLADADDTWKKLRKRADDLESYWRNVLASAEHGALFAAAFARLGEASPAAPSDPALEGAILSIAEYAKHQHNPSYLAEAVDRLVTLSGLPFALRAVVAQIDTWVPPSDKPQVARRTSLPDWSHGRRYLSPFDHLRLRAATADDAAYAAALDVARELHRDAPNDLTRAALAYMFPGENGWADAILQAGSLPRAEALVTATRSADVLARAIGAARGGYHLLTQHTEEGSAARFAAILALAGTSKPVLDALFAFYDKLGGSEYERGASSVLGLVDTHDALVGLVSRAEKKDIQIALGQAIERSPALAVPALSEVAVSRARSADIARQLLATTLRKGVEGLDAIIADLPEAQRKLVEAVRASTEPVASASAEEVPEALVKPRWLGAKKKAVASIEIAAPPHVDAFAWPKGVREALPRDVHGENAGRHGDPVEIILGWLDLPKTLKDQVDESVIATACGSTHERRRWGGIAAGFGILPEALALAILKHTPSARWSTHNALSGFSTAVTRFELRIADDVVRLANDLTTHCFALLMPYDIARAAPVVARAYAELKKLRSDAERWLRLHPSAAIAGLLPAAVGKASKARTHAETALRFLAGEGHRDAILAAAKTAGALEQTIAVLDFDPLDLYPAKIPPLPAFADPGKLTAPVLTAKDGRRGGALPPDAVRNLVTMLAISLVDGPYAGLEIAKQTCTKASLAAFAWDVFTGWLLSGASSKEQWAMNALAHLGDDECARKLAAKVREWPGESAHARAVSGLDVLAAMGTDVALMHLHGISQKLKFKGLQEKAREKIGVIAEARGLTEDELGDRLVPDLGLEDDGKLTLDFGPRAFQVTFDESLKPIALDAASKRLPDLPKPGKSDDAEKSKEAVERWKALKKDAKTIATQQVLRLELAMCSRRRWTAPVFRQFLVEHPVVRHLVRRLAWATYGEDGAPRALFRVAEDGSFADTSDDTFTLEDGASIGIVHALEMKPADAAKMGQVLADYEILQPFPQLGRETFALADAERNGTKLVRVKGAKVPTGKVLGLESRGWRRGEPQDGGGIWWMQKNLPGELEARLSMDPGISVGMIAETPEQTLGEVELYGEGEWSASGKPFGALDAIVASELVRDLESLRS